MNLRQLFRAAAVFCALVSAASASAVTLLTNGSFELASGIGPNATVSPGASNLVGWTVIGGGNLLWCDPSYCSIPPSQGSYSLDLTGLTNVAPYAGVQQTVATLPGVAYEFTFDLTGRSDSTPVSVRASAGAASSIFATSLSAWTSQKLSFTANATSTSISILGISAGGSGLALQIDNAAVVAAAPVPEPASAILLLAGGAFLIAARHRLGARRSRELGSIGGR